MDPLVAALAGGAVGAAVASLARVPAQVRRHNRLVTEYDQELANWVADESVRLDREMKRTSRRFSESGREGERVHARALAQLKEESLRAYRDSELTAKQRRAALRDEEGWQHDLWRWITVRGQLAPLRTPRKAQPILDTWREPASVGAATVQVGDPTGRDLDEVLTALAEKQASAEADASAPTTVPEGARGEGTVHRAEPRSAPRGEELPQGG